MTTEANRSPRPNIDRRLSPDHVRGTRFGRTALARRGLDENEVYRFIHRLAHEMSLRDAEITKLMDENRRLKQAMRDWHGRDPDTGMPPEANADAQPALPVGQATQDAPPAAAPEQVTVETASLMAKAQQQIDAQVAQAELYCRQREEAAARRYDEIVRAARTQAQADAERVAQHYRATAGPDYSGDREQLQRQQVYLTALLHALDALASHLHATRQTFAWEVQKLSGLTEVRDPGADDPTTASP